MARALPGGPKPSADFKTLRRGHLLVLLGLTIIRLTKSKGQSKSNSSNVRHEQTSNAKRNGDKRQSDTSRGSVVFAVNPFEHVHAQMG